METTTNTDMRADTRTWRMSKEDFITYFLDGEYTEKDHKRILKQLAKQIHDEDPVELEVSTNSIKCEEWQYNVCWWSPDLKISGVKNKINTSSRFAMCQCGWQPDDY